MRNAVILPLVSRPLCTLFLSGFMFFGMFGSVASADMLIFSGNEDQPMPVTLSPLDFNAPPYDFQLVTRPAHGVLSGVTPALVYTPASDYFGTDSFTYGVTDGTQTFSASVDLVVQPVNDLPGLLRSHPNEMLLRGNRPYDWALIYKPAVAAEGDTAVVGVYDMVGLGDVVHVFVRSNGVWQYAAQLAPKYNNAQDFFGESVAISGDTVAVGAWGRDFGTGMVYVFEKPAGGWSGTVYESAQLQISDKTSGDMLAESLAISGDTVVAGSTRKFSYRGAAFVFTKPTGGWSGSLTENARLIASDGTDNDWFSESIAVFDDTVVVGADRSGYFSGGAYVYTKPAGGWSGTLTENARLTGSDNTPSKLFGSSASIHGDTIAIGAPGKTTEKGAVYLFAKPAGGWNGTLTESHKLMPSDEVTNDQFGCSLSLDDDRLAVAAQVENGKREALYFYRKISGDWVDPTLLAAKHVSVEPSKTSSFLQLSVALANDGIVMGSQGSIGNFMVGVARVFQDSLEYTENAPARYWDHSVILQNPDQSTLTGAVVQITQNYTAGEDILDATDRGGLEGVWDASSGTYTLSGAASLGVYQDALRSLTYRNASEDPSDAVRSMSCTLFDGPNDSQTFVNWLRVHPVNDMPVITTPAAFDFPENATAVCTLSASDCENDPLVFSVAGGPDQSLFMVNGGTLRFLSPPNFESKADSDHNNIYSVDVRVSDGILSSTQALSVSVHDVNEPPFFVYARYYLSLPYHLLAVEDIPYSSLIFCDDPDSPIQELFYSAARKPDWLTVSEVRYGIKRGALSGTPTNGDVGTNTITIRVSDGELYTDQTFEITVENVNDPPFFQSIPIRDADPGREYRYAVTAVDLDPGDSIRSLTAPVLPAWLTFTDLGRGQGLLTGTPGADDEGQHSVSLRARDGEVYVDQSYIIQVHPAAAQSYPSPTATSAPEATATPSSVDTPTPTSSVDATVTVTPELTTTPTSTDAPGVTPTASSAPADTPLSTDTPTAEITPTPTDETSPVDTPSVTPTPTDTPSPTSTPAPTATPSLVPTTAPSSTPAAPVTPTATPSVTPTPSPRTPPQVTVTDNAGAFADLSNGWDCDASSNPDLAIRWTWTGLGVDPADVKEAHVYVSRNGSVYTYLGRQVAGADPCLEWRRNSSSGALLALDFRQGPVFGNVYRFRVYLLRTTGGFYGPYENAGPVELRSAVWVADNLASRLDLCDGTDFDTASARSLVLRWDARPDWVSLRDVLEYHVYVQEGSDPVYRYLGRTSKEGAYFEWKPEGLRTDAVYRAGPQFGSTYRFRVYALTVNKPNKYEDARGPVLFMEDQPFGPTPALADTPSSPSPTPSVTPTPPL